MKYTKFTFKNLKGISDTLDIDLETYGKKPICIVGNNESGKTTVLLGINLIGKLCQNINNVKEDGIIKYRPKAGLNFSDSIELSADVCFDRTEYKILQEQIESSFSDSDNVDNMGCRLLQKIKNEGYKINIKFIFNFEMSKLMESKIQIFGEESEHEIIREFIANNVPDIVYLEDFVFNVPDTIRFSKDKDAVHSDVVLESKSNKAWQTIFNDILKGAMAEDSARKKEKISNPSYNIMDPFGIFETMITVWRIDSPKDTAAVKQRISGMENFINKTIKKDWVNISGLKFSFDRFEIEYRDNGAFDDYALKVHEGGNVFDISERSKGCRWFFSFKILTKIRSYRDNKKTIFLLDEPASNLHIYPQDKILESLKDLAKKNHVIYTTHAPHLIDPHSLDHCLVAINRKSKENADANISITKYESLSEKDKSSQSVDPIMERGILKALNNESIPWRKWWDKVKEANVAENIVDKVTTFFN